MKKNVKMANVIEPMIWLCVLLISACSQQEYDVGVSLPEKVTNKDAQRFVEALKASTDQHHIWFRKD